MELGAISGGVILSEPLQTTIGINLSVPLGRIDGIAEMRTAIPIEDHILSSVRFDRIVRSAEVAAGRKQADCPAHAAPVTVRRMAIARATP
jgi:hypothetical protein